MKVIQLRKKFNTFYLFLSKSTLKLSKHISINIALHYGEDAIEAKERLNHAVIRGREIRIVFAEENRKTPQEMRTTSRPSGRNSSRQRRTPTPRSPRHRYRSSSRSPSPTRRDSRDRGARDDRYSPRWSRSASRSPSPRDEKDYKSNERSPIPRENGQSPHAVRDLSPNGSRSPRADSRSPPRSRSPRADSRSHPLFTVLQSVITKMSHYMKLLVGGQCTSTY